MALTNSPLTGDQGSVCGLRPKSHNNKFPEVSPEIRDLPDSFKAVTPALSNHQKEQQT
jgi:hypothetical protein